MADGASAMGGQTFDTSNVAPEARIAAWCHAVKSLHFEMSFDAYVRTPYRAAFRSYATDDFRLISFEEEECSFSRDSDHIRNDPNTDIEFVTPLVGTCTIEQFGVTSECQTGQFVLFDANARFRIFQPQKMAALMLKVSRREIERRFSDVEALCGRPVACATGLPRLAVDLLRSIDREGGSMNPGEFRASCSHLLDLLALAVVRRETTSCSNSAVRLATFKRIKAYMRDKACDPNFSISDISTHLSISERYIQALFQDAGTTMRDYLGELRLGRAREMLGSPRYKRKSITEIAFDCGFSSSAYFSTRFRENTQLTPTEYRNSFTSP